MKVLITGGTGYIGRNLRGVIRDMGHEVRLLVRPGSEGKVESTGDYELINGDIFNTNACLAASDGCDVIVHLVGIVREYPARGITFDQHHRVATENMVSAAKINGVQRFIHMSAMGTRADAKSDYHRTKFVGEQLVRESGLRWTIFQPSWISGAGDHGTELIVDLIQKPVVPMIDGGKLMLQPIAIEDVCRAAARSIEMPETQGKTYELGGPDRISFREMVEKIAAQIGMPIRTVDVPMALVRPVAALMERYPWFPASVDQLRIMTEDNVGEIDAFVKTFQIEPKPFSQVLPTLFGTTGQPRKTSALL